jgi:TolB-like protein
VNNNESAVFVERIKRLLSPSNSEASAMASGVSAAASELVHTSRRSRLVELIIATVVTCAAIVYLLADWPGISITTKGFFGATGALNSANSAGSEAALALPAHSVAVLPFTNLSGDPQQEYFSDGISEELINALSHIDALAVAARTSSFAFKGKEVDVVTIGRQLHVGAILEGSIRRSGNTIRITAQLINSATGFHMWSEDYDRDLRDILVLQTDIATAVAQQLRAKLLGGEAARIELGGTHVPAAYDAYLLGRQLDRMNTLDGYRRAAAANLKATELDPLYARAYANLSLAEANAADYTNDLVGLENARLAAEKALSLQPELVDGYIARFAVRRYLLDFSGARADAERALALSPNKTNSQTVYGTMLATFGRLPEAIAAMNKAIELDPLNESAWLDLAQYFTVGHDFPAAHRAFERAQAISPDDDVGHFALGILDLLEGRHENSFAEFQAGDEVVRLTGMALVEHSRGNEPKSQQALAALIAKHSVEAAYQVAEVYAWRGDKNKAFEWLDRSFRQRDDGLSDVVYDVLLTDLRTDPRYRVLLKRLKLLEE